LFIEDTGGQFGGICMASPTVISLSCIAPSNLAPVSINTTSASFDWVVNGTETFWEVEFGLQGFTLGTGTLQQTSSHPIGIAGLSPNTAYDIYVRADCSDGDGVIFSNWVGPVMFTTATLGIADFTLEGLKIFPNPTHGMLELKGVNIDGLSLYSFTGQRLIDKKVSQSDLKLDLSAFKSGIYLLKISANNGKSTGIYKIIKD
jgi:hypothetical protein